MLTTFKHPADGATPNPCPRKPGPRTLPIDRMVPPHPCVLANEDLDAYCRQADLNTAKYRPRDEREAQLVRQITDYEWKILRAQTLETHLINREILHSYPSVESTHPSLENIDVTMIALRTLAQSRLFESLRKESAQYYRTIDQLEKRLRALQRYWPAPEAPEVSEQLPVESAPVPAPPPLLAKPSQPSRSIDQTLSNAPSLQLVGKRPAASESPLAEPRAA